MDWLKALRWLVDETIDTVRRNSRKGTGTGHWYPPDHVGNPNYCFYCGKLDMAREQHTLPACPGKKP